MVLNTLREQRDALQSQIREINASIPEQPAEADLPCMAELDAKLSELEAVENNIKDALAQIKAASDRVVAGAAAEFGLQKRVITDAAAESLINNGDGMAAIKAVSNVFTNPSRHFAGETRIGIEASLADFAPRNTVSTVGTDAKGGYLVTKDAVAPTLWSYFGEQSDFFSVVKRLTTSTGARIEFPLSDDSQTYNKTAIKAEGATAGETDMLFKQIPIDTYVYNSQIFKVSEEMVADSEVNIVEYIMQKLIQNLSYTINLDMTSGTGSKISGLLPAATVNLITGQSGLKPASYDDIISLELTVPKSIRSRRNGSVGYMMNDSVWAECRKITDKSGQPIFGQGAYGRMEDITSPQRYFLNGYPVFINPAMPSTANGALSIIFGDFQNYIMRVARDVRVQRFADSPYASAGLIGFMADMRVGGAMIDSGVSFAAFKAKT